jgi:pSer/pThr/pTyr-binding forkhead associated (FHA) protein
MTTSPLAPHQATPAELRERLAAERGGTPFLVYRDGDGSQRILELGRLDGRLTIGRSPECDVPLTWDPEVSRLHAELERVKDRWLVVDDGLSSNGTFVGGQRLHGRRRLADADLVRVGATLIAFREPAAAVSATTLRRPEGLQAVRVTESQRRVLIALCRPFKDGAADATPTTNPQIAAELVLTVAAIKTHLRALFRAFEIDDLPQQEKRRRLVTLAFASGVVSDRDL